MAVQRAVQLTDKRIEVWMYYNTGNPVILRQPDYDAAERLVRILGQMSTRKRHVVSYKFKNMLGQVIKCGNREGCQND